MHKRIARLLTVAALVAAVLSVAEPAQGAALARLRVVQRASASTGDDTASSLQVSFVNPTLDHSVLVLLVTNDGIEQETAQSVVDSAGNDWALVGSVSPGSTESEIWYAKNALPTTSVTITWATFTGRIVLDAYEVSGADRNIPLAGVTTGTAAVDASGCQTTIDPGPPNYLAVGLVTGDLRQRITIAPAFKPARQISAGSSLTMRTAYLAPANGEATLAGTWATPMTCSALAIALKTKQP